MLQGLPHRWPQTAPHRCFLRSQGKNNRQSGCRPPRSSAKARPRPAPHSPPLQARPGSDTARRPLHTPIPGGCWQGCSLPDSAAWLQRTAAGRDSATLPPKGRARGPPAKGCPAGQNRGPAPARRCTGGSTGTAGFCKVNLRRAAPAQAPCSAQGPRSFPAFARTRRGSYPPRKNPLLSIPDSSPIRPATRLQAGQGS